MFGLSLLLQGAATRDMADAEHQQRMMAAHAQMENFDLLTMSYPAAPMPGAMDGMGAGPGMLALDNTSNFDAETYAG